MKLKKYIVVVALILCGGLTACHHVLDTAPYHQVATGNMWQTERLTEMGVQGIYANLRNWGVRGGGLNAGGAGQWAFEQVGPLGQSHEGTQPLVHGTLGPNTGTTAQHWRRLFEGVHRANDAIYNIPRLSPVSEERAARFVAEARFLRAFHYFRLNELWRGVPWYDTPIAIHEATRGQETEEFIWERIIEDLTAVINEPQIPDIDLTSARVTRGAAYALRGRVHMQMGNWQLAANDFARVGPLGFGLFQGDYRLLFTEANNFSIEHVFSIENIQGHGWQRGSSAHFMFGTRSAQGSCWADQVVHPFAVSLYENLDGTPFSWDDHLPGFSTMPITAREVFFLRDTLRADGTGIDPRITSLVRDRLDALGTEIATLYLPYGNEARIRAAYAGRDPRLAANVITLYSEFIGIHPTIAGEELAVTSRWPRVTVASALLPDGETFIADLQSDRANEVRYFHRKFVYEGFNGTLFNREQGGINDPIIRYADVLLMWAEALIELNRLSEAQALVAQVRDRVGMPTLASNFADQATARNFVRDERRREMLGEGGSFFDELRWGTFRQTKFAADEAGPAGPRNVWGAPTGGPQFRWPDLLNSDRMVWPIPLSEIQRNPNLRPTPHWTY